MVVSPRAVTVEMHNVPLRHTLKHFFEVKYQFEQSLLMNIKFDELLSEIDNDLHSYRGYM